MPWNRAERLVDHANTLSCDGNFEAATKLLGEALSLAPNLAYAHTVLAMNQLRQERIAAALRSIQNALNLDPNDPYVQFVAGNIALSRKDYQSAEKHFRDGIALDNTYVFNFISLAELFHDKRNPHKALALLKEAKALAPDECSVAVVRASILFDLGRIKEADEEARLAIRIDPDNTSACVMLASVQLFLRNHTEAKELAVSALMKNPRDTAARLLIGEIASSENWLLQSWWQAQRFIQWLPVYCRLLVFIGMGLAIPLLGSSIRSLGPDESFTRNILQVVLAVDIGLLIYIHVGSHLNEWIVNRALKEAEISRDF